MRLQRLGMAAALVAGCAACLPRLEDPPLTVSGEAPVGWSPGKPSAVGGGDAGAGADASAAVAPTKCSGTMGTVPTPQQPTLRPCAVVNVVTAGLTAQQLTTLSLTTSIANLTVSKSSDFSALKSLVQVETLTLANWNEATAHIPDTVNVTASVSVSGQMTSLTGGGGIKTLNGTLSVYPAPKLKTLLAFQNLYAADLVTIRGCPLLADMNTFKQLQNLNAFKLMDVNVPSIKQPTLNVAKLASIELANNPNLPGFFLFNTLNQVGTLVIQGNGTLSQFWFKQLQSIDTLHVAGNPNVASLDDLGQFVQVKQQLTVCDTALSGSKLEAWRQAHAPNLQFTKCKNGCTGAECP
ncbi:MAG: hypothetical protein FJ100_01960 [Deltaproteobacteria bacterium]|nr:hypothetical protein [Deltaproteobacteria bacterium]